MTENILPFNIPQIDLSMPEQKQDRLNELQASVQELISCFSEPSKDNHYLTSEEIFDAIKQAFEEEIKWRQEQLRLITNSRERICTEIKPFIFD
tara:strand:+ start:452 stop:733 length:282 start_codon:yes stop_codon:yes gene_type:complete